MFGKLVGRLGIVPRSPLQRAISALKALYATGVQGVWYDPSDLNRYMTTGEELVTNGDGTSLSGWTGSTGYSVVSGTLKCDGVTTEPNLIQPIGVVQGKTYIVKFTQSGRTSGNCYLVLGGAQPAGTPNLIGEQTYQFVLTCTTNSGTISFSTPSGTFNGSFDNISVRELPAIGTATLFQDSAGTTPVTAVEQSVGRMLDKSGRGNHATQSTAINRPVLSARVNLFTETEFRNGVTDAATRGGLLTATTLTGYAGALAFGHDGSTSTFAYKSTLSTVSGTTYRISAVVEMTDGLAPAFASASMNNVAVDFAFIVGGGVTVPNTYTVTSIGGALYRVSCTAVAGASAGNNGVLKYSTNSNRTFKVTAYQIELGSVATRYQRINTATDYDTVGFNHYLKFNGTNSGMSTGNIDFTGTDKMMVCAGVRKLSDAIDQATIVELGTNSSSTAGSFALQCSPAFTGRYRMQLFGSSRGVRDTLLNTFAAPNTSVLTMLSDIAQSTISQEIIARANGAVLSMDNVLSPAGTGNFGNYPLYIGARAGTSLFLNGNIYGLIIAGTAATPAQIAAAERIINDDTGAY